MDEYTKNHLMAWVKNHAPVHYTDTDACYQAMLAYCMENDATERGWPSVFDGMMDSKHRPILRGYSRRYTAQDSVYGTTYTCYVLAVDQPTTCPQCGARTDYVTLPGGQQQHTCLACSYIFVGEFA